MHLVPIASIEKPIDRNSNAMKTFVVCCSSKPLLGVVVGQSALLDLAAIGGVPSNSQQIATKRSIAFVRAVEVGSCRVQRHT